MPARNLVPAPLVHCPRRLAMAYAAKPFTGDIVWHNKTVCIAAPPTQYIDHNSTWRGAADLWCVPRTDRYSTNIRAVVVFPMNGRSWGSDFHPFHDAMRLWWLLEFAIAAKRQGLSVFFSLQRQVSSLGEPRQAMAMAHNRAHWPRADCCARQARCAAGSTKRLSGLRRAST